MTSEMVEKLRYGKNVESWWELGAQAADELERLTSAIERKDAALRPFAAFAVSNVGADGWNEIGLSTKDERVVDWFGPSDFREARAALGATK